MESLTVGDLKEKYDNNFDDKEQKVLVSIFRVYQAQPTRGVANIPSAMCQKVCAFLTVSGADAERSYQE